MKILLVRPPSIMQQEHAHALQHPINLCWLAAVARGDGFATAVLDYEVQPYSAAGFSAAVSESGAGVVGFTAMTPSVDFAAGMAAAAAAVAPGVVTVLGGAHASILPVETLKRYPQFRVAVMGEGERAFLDICRAVRDGALGDAEIPSAVIGTGGGVRGDPAARAEPVDLETLPVPARELLDLKLYRGAPTPGLPGSVFRATQLFTARGCPGNCIFCCSEHIFGRRVRSRSVDHIMTEVEDCIDRFGFNHFTIDNDTFTYDRAGVIEFCGRMAGRGVTWDCDTRVDRVDEELLKTMSESGCVKVAFGVETGSERILRLIKKGITLEQVRDAFRWTRRAGMLSCAFIMVGNHPDETEADIAASVKLIREIDPDLISVAIATPYPGTELNEMMRSEGLLGDPPWSAYGQSFQGEPLTRTKSVTAARLKELQVVMLRKFFLRPRYVLRRLARVRSPRDAAYWVAAGLQFISYLTRRGARGR